MITNTTSHLGLPLAHEQNDLEDDVLRIISAFKQVDSFAQRVDAALAAADAALAARLEQASATDESLATLILRVAANELAHAVLEGTVTGHGESLLAQAAKITALEQRAFFGVCDTPGAEAAKALTLPGFALAPGVSLDIIFSEVNAAEEMTLAINEGEPVPVLHQGVPPEVAQLAKGQIYSLKYSGAAWQIMAGMAPDRVGQTHWFEDTLGRPGFVPYTGATIEEFAARWPQMAVYLATAHGRARCFASLEEREAAHTEVWHTLASGETISWEGLGGVTKYYYDAQNDILYMPDLRGMMRSMAGDGVVAASMGDRLGDRSRNIVGAPHMDGGQYPLATIMPHNTSISDGVLIIRTANNYLNRGTSSGAPTATVDIDASRVVPVGASNTTRHWASLACAYFGQPGA